MYMVTGKEPIQAESHSHSSALGNIIRAGGDSCKEVTSEVRSTISEEEEEEHEMPLGKTKGFQVDVKRKSIEDKVSREVFEVDEALAIDNSRASSFQLREIHVYEIKVHAVRDWSSPKTLSEVRNIKVAEAFQEEDELEYVEPLDGEAEQVTNVVQRTLCSPKVSDSSQINKIFQTKCLVKEKICSIVIDGGSCENLVANDLVKAFKFPTEPHPSSFKIGWIKKGPTLKVTEICNICKVPLVIGKHYNELVTCDVDMKAYHVLLRRPWQNNMDATHQGKSNMYLFKWSGKTIAILPLSVVSPKTKLENKTLVTLVASPKEFQADIIGSIMAVEDEPLMMLGLGTNIIKEDFCNDLDGQHSADESNQYHNTLRWNITRLKWGNVICIGQICTNVWLKQEMVCAQRRKWDLVSRGSGITLAHLLKDT
ncbi:hypothetical protein Tco_1219459 [Tanacetum coccineum]